MNEKKSSLRKFVEYFFSGVVVVFVLLLVLWFINYFKIFKRPSFISDFFDGEKKDSDTAYSDESHLYEFLEQSGVSENSVSFAEIEKENVNSFVDVLTSKKGYYYEVETTVFYDGRSTATDHMIWNEDDYIRVDSKGKNLDNTYIVTHDGIEFSNNLTGEKRKIEGDVDFTPENIINIADVRFYLNSEYSETVDAKLVQAEEEKCLYLKFYTERYNKTDEFYISLDKGVVLSSTSQIDGVLTFYQKTKEFTYSSDQSRQVQE